MAAAMGMAAGSSSPSSAFAMRDVLKKRNHGGKKGNGKNRRVNAVAFVSASAATSVADPYETLRVQRGATEPEVKKAFRRLALQYHPDVCREDNCTLKFHQINEAYDVILSSLRGETDDYVDVGIDEPFRGMNSDESEWDLWEEWMGWEGAGIRDYSSHINPYI